MLKLCLIMAINVSRTVSIKTKTSVKVTLLLTTPFKKSTVSTALLATYRNSSDDAYDNGNIISITQGTTSVTYEYNGANEWVRLVCSIHISTAGRGTVPCPDRSCPIP